MKYRYCTQQIYVNQRAAHILTTLALILSLTACYGPTGADDESDVATDDRSTAIITDETKPADSNSDVFDPVFRDDTLSDNSSGTQQTGTLVRFLPETTSINTLMSTPPVLQDLRILGQLIDAHSGLY